MNHMIYLLIASFFFVACNDNESSNSNATTVTTTATNNTTEVIHSAPPKVEKTITADLDTELDISECVGIYSKGGHDESWLLGIREYDGRVEALLIHFDGMLPPLDMLQQANVELEGSSSQKFPMNINTTEMTFTYELGDGSIDGNKVVFNNKTEYVPENLTLIKDGVYSALMEDK